VAKAIDKAMEFKRTAVAVLGLEVPHAHLHLIPMNDLTATNFEKPKREIPKDRDILKLINEIKESAKMFLIKAAQNLLPNEQDAGNGIIRNELVWDINGYLDGLVEKGYVQDYQVVCDNRNNPREVFEKGELDAEILIVWDEEHRNTFYKIRVNKKGQVTNVGE